MEKTQLSSDLVTAVAQTLVTILTARGLTEADTKEGRKDIFDYLSGRKAVSGFTQVDIKSGLAEMWGAEGYYDVMEETFEQLRAQAAKKAAYDRRYNRRVILVEGDGDMESEVLARPIIGEPNAYRLAQLERIAAEHSWREGCSHEWDCCGCQFSQSVRVEKRETGYFMVMAKAYNY
jgi:hypothetical protein